MGKLTPCSFNFHATIVKLFCVLSLANLSSDYSAIVICAWGETGATAMDSNRQVRR